MLQENTSHSACMFRGFADTRVGVTWENIHSVEFGSAYICDLGTHTCVEFGITSGEGEQVKVAVEKEEDRCVIVRCKYTLRGEGQIRNKKMPSWELPAAKKRLLRYLDVACEWFAAEALVQKHVVTVTGAGVRRFQRSSRSACM
jgi:hypothetical protein